jgi:hypothetical protein
MAPHALRGVQHGVKLLREERFIRRPGILPGCNCGESGEYCREQEGGQHHPR